MRQRSESVPGVTQPAKNAHHAWMRGGALAAVIAWAAAAGPAAAEIVFFGSINPSPPGLSGSNLVVGDDDASNDVTLGYLEVNGGTTLDYNRLVIGDENDFVGDVVVTGAGSSILLTDTNASNDPALQVGEFGTGRLMITDRGFVDVSDTSNSSGSNGTAVLGFETSAAGFVTVDGRLSRFAVGDNLIIGRSGYGELTVTGGAFAYFADPDDGLLVLGQNAPGAGVATVDGAGTFFQLPQTVTVGGAGAGTLRITNGASADGANNFSGSFTVGDRGLVELAGGGRLLTDAMDINGRVQGDGLITGRVTISADGQVTAASGDRLRFTGDVTNQGLIDASGSDTGRAEIELLGALTNTDPGGANPPGRIAVGDGVVRFNQPLVNNGVLASTSGVTDFHGTITNGATGLIAIGGGSNATFYDNVSVTAGTLNIAAGSTALFLGDISISAGVSLAIEIDEGATQDGFNTPLQSSGVAQLNTPISLSLAPGFVPEAGASFDLVSAAGGVSVGVIDANNFDPLPQGLAWSLQNTGNTLSAVVSTDGVDPGLNPQVATGDFNGDGFVDGADYALWRGSLG
ncbi:MAG: hypothetical protein AAF790_14465, partial [Planctomycetota bacterium]